MTIHEALKRPSDRWPGRKLQTPKGSGGLRLLEYPTKASVLGVAHLDSVPCGGHARGSSVRVPKPINRPSFIAHPALDDRLGAWALLLLRSAGLPIDILFTEDEEIGQSTASYFFPDKQYNWAFSFDRAGIDAVLYQYEWNSPDFASACADHWPLGIGSYSCIADLQTECPAVNVGIGYHDHNTATCWADLNETAAQLRVFGDFFGEYAETKWPIPTEDKYTIQFEPRDRYSAFDPFDDYDMGWMDGLSKESALKWEPKAKGSRKLSATGKGR